MSDKERLIKGTASKISNFSTINYDALRWEADGSVINTTSFELDDSKQVKVNVNRLADGSAPQKGEVMTLLNTDEVLYKEELIDLINQERERAEGNHKKCYVLTGYPRQRRAFRADPCS